MCKIIHHIWIGDREMPEREKQYVRRIKELNPSFNQMLWYDDNLPDMPSGIKKKYDFFREAKVWVVCADILRQYLVYEYGGIYADVDYEPLQSLDALDLEKYEGFLYHGGDEDLNISNGMFGFRAKHPLSAYIIDKIIVQPPSWYGPTWFGRMIKEYYGLEYTSLTSELELKMDSNIKFIHVFEQQKVMLHQALYSWSKQNYPTYKKRDNKNPFL